MMRPTSSTLQDFCRACLDDVKHRQKYKVNMMDPKIRLWLEDCKSNSKSPSNAYPESICKRCYDKLSDILKFQKICTRSLKTVDDILQDELKRQQNQIEMSNREYLLKNSLNVDEQMSVLNDIYGNHQWPDYNHHIRHHSNYQCPIRTASTPKTEPAISLNLRDKSTRLSTNSQDSIRYITEESKLKHLSTYDSQSIKTTYSQQTTTVIKNSNSLNTVNFKVIDGSNLDQTLTAKQSNNIGPNSKTSSSQKGIGGIQGNDCEMKIYPSSFRDDAPKACTKCGMKPEYPQQMANSDSNRPKATSTPTRSVDHITHYRSRRSLTEHDISRISNSSTKFACSQSTIANRQFVRRSCMSSSRISGQLELPSSQNIKSSSLTLRERRLQNILHKPYHCEQCGKRFIQLVSLKTHLKTHDNLLIKMKSLSIIV